MWFRIKSRSKFTFGPSHLYHLLQLVQTQPEHMQQVARKPIQNYAYFADPGIMVTSMIESEDKSIRKIAVKIIRERREQPPQPLRLKTLKGIKKS